MRHQCPCQCRYRAGWESLAEAPPERARPSATRDKRRKEIFSSRSFATPRHGLKGAENPRSSTTRYRLVQHGRESDAGEAQNKENEHQRQEASRLRAGAAELFPDEYAPDGGDHRPALAERVRSGRADHLRVGRDKIRRGADCPDNPAQDAVEV